MARRATSLGPKPSLLFFLLFFFGGGLCFFVCFFWEGFGPPHLALSPPLLFFVCFFVSFLSLLLIEKTVSALEKGIFYF